MFVINQKKIYDTFQRDAFTKNYDKFREIKKKLHTAADTVRAMLNEKTFCAVDAPTEQEAKFAIEFAENMQASLDFIDANKDDIESYFRIRNFLSESDMTPETLEYFVFGNADAGAYEFPDDINPENVMSDGYLPEITKIVSNDPVTIVQFADGSEVRVTNTSSDTFDAHEGVYLAILKKAIGSHHLQHLFALLDEALKPDTSKPAASDSKTEPNTDGTTENSNLTVNGSAEQTPSDETVQMAAIGSASDNNTSDED